VPDSFDYLLAGVFALVQWRISAAVWQRWGRSRRVLWWILLANAIIAFSYLCSYSGAVNWLDLPPLPATIAGGVALTYLITASAVYVIYSVLQPISKHFQAKVNPGRRAALNTVSNTLLVAPFAAMGYGSFIERWNFHVREIDVPVRGLHQDLDGIRILQLSDIHLSPFLSERDFARVIDAAMETKPHLTAVTGDLISSHGDPLDACIRQLARIKCDAGVFGCLGNHEHYARAEDYTEAAAARVGIQFLRTRAQALRFGNAVLNVAGVDHQSHSRGRKYLVGTERLVAPGACNVLLSHNPDVFPVAERQGYNLVLSGHTHGGQINVEILDEAVNPARFFTPYVYGLYRSQGASAYVTRGIGTIGIPARIGAPPEISVIRLRKA
jgi:predicted MPP superfamily phosphohydrolase